MLAEAKGYFSRVDISKILVIRYLKYQSLLLFVLALDHLRTLLSS